MSSKKLFIALVSVFATLVVNTVCIQFAWNVFVANVSFLHEITFFQAFALKVGIDCLSGRLQVLPKDTK